LKIADPILAVLVLLGIPLAVMRALPRQLGHGLAKLAGGNVLRVTGDAERVAAQRR
jgi:hypothetical protein